MPPADLAALLDLPGVLESTLGEEAGAALPRATPAPPWRCRVRATLWAHRATGEAPEVAPGRRTLPLTTVGLIEYVDSPVGAYTEVLASPVVLLAPRLLGLPRARVPFIAVDSLASVHGGRAHWGLPKTVATFVGDVQGETAVAGDGWSVRAQVRPRGPGVPVAAPFVLEQQDGRPAPCRAVGRVRAARVEVETAGPTLPRWVRAGTWPGVVLTGRLVVGPRPARPTSVRQRS